MKTKDAIEAAKRQHAEAETAFRRHAEDLEKLLADPSVPASKKDEIRQELAKLADSTPGPAASPSILLPAVKPGTAKA